MDSPKEDLRDAKDHAKQAATATLKAMRSALDLAISKLEGDDQPPNADVPAPDAARPGNTQTEDPTRVV